MTPLKRTFERFSAPVKRTFSLILQYLTKHPTPHAKIAGHRLVVCGQVCLPGSEIALNKDFRATAVLLRKAIAFF
jgi:hypothetical protein